MLFKVEHFRAIEVPESSLGYEYTPTGVVVEIEAHSEEDAAAAALSTAADEPDVGDVVTFDPGRGLYAVAGEDDAVRVTVLS
jgi:hypothetical protein